MLKNDYVYKNMSNTLLFSPLYAIIEVELFNSLFIFSTKIEIVIFIYL